MHTSPLALDDIGPTLLAIGEAADRQEAMRAVDLLAGKAIGRLDCTIFRTIAATAEVERIYSSKPARYPLGGRKRMADYPTNQAVLARGEVYLAGSRLEVQRTYRDAEHLFANGVTSVLNAPVRHAGATLGALNLFGEEGWFDAARIARARAVAALLAPVLLAWRE